MNCCYCDDKFSSCKELYHHIMTDHNRSYKATEWRDIIERKVISVIEQTTQEIISKLSD